MSTRNNNTPLISVIIPVWNPGPGITRCIESLRNQTLQEIEMIFVDDCGTDNSMEPVWAAAAEDARIRIIENGKNIGVGPSRNRGIDAASGEYLSFIDPDDYVAPDFFELLYVETYQYSFDIVKGTVIHQKENGTIAENNSNNNSRIREGTQNGKPLFLLFESEHQSAIYKRETLVSTHSRYGSSIRGEDSTFLLQICSQARTISTVDEAYYYFCERFDSALHTLDKPRLEGGLQSIIEKINYALHNLPNDSWSNEYLQNRFLFAIRDGYRFIYLPDIDDALSEYTLCLQSQLLRLPSRELLIRRSFSLQALQNHAYLLPATPPYYAWEGSNPPIRYAELTKRWVDYYINYPEERTACIRDFLSLLIRARLAVYGKPKSSYSTEELNKGRKDYKEQINRLPARIRTSLIRHYFVARVSLLLPKSTKEKIKKHLIRQQ